MFMQIQEFLFAHVPWAYAIVFFFFGASVGSFLNVVICRLPHEISILNPPSSCPFCGKRIFGLDNLPVISWIILGGKCRQCKAPIPWRYPGVELLTGILWAAVAYMNAMNDFGHFTNIAVMVFYFFFVSALIAATFIDFDYQIIPDEITFGGLGVALVASYALPMLHPEFVGMFSGVKPRVVGLMGGFAGAAAGAVLMLVLTGVGTLLMQKQIKKAQEEDPDINSAIGMGDTKLMAFIGAALGWKEVLAAFFVGTIVGAFVGVFEKLRTGEWPPEDAPESKGGALKRFAYRWHSGLSVMPYGPFLAIGGLVMLYAREPVLKFFHMLFTPGAMREALACLTPLL